MSPGGPTPRTASFRKLLPQIKSEIPLKSHGIDTNVVSPDLPFLTTMSLLCLDRYLKQASQGARHAPDTLPVDLQRVHAVLALDSVLARLSCLADQTTIFIPAGGKHLRQCKGRVASALCPSLLHSPSGCYRPASANSTSQDLGRWAQRSS